MRENHSHQPELNFCPVCAGKLVSRGLNDGEPARPVCSKCGFVFYLDPKLVACTITEREGKIALVKRAISPQKGKWVMPGGYVDRGEEVEAAAVRETLEECGLSIRIRRLLNIYSYSGSVPVVVVYLAHYLSGDLMAGKETLEARWVAPEGIPWQNLAFKSTAHALSEYLREVYD